MTARDALLLLAAFAASLALTAAFLAYRSDAMGLVLGAWKLCV